MIRIYTKDNHAKKLIEMIFAAADKENGDSTYSFDTWELITVTVGDDNIEEKRINHTDGDWSKTAILKINDSTLLKDNVITIIPRWISGCITEEIYKSKRPHIQGRFIGALLSNMPKEFIKIEVIPD